MLGSGLGRRLGISTSWKAYEGPKHKLSKAIYMSVRGLAKLHASGGSDHAVTPTNYRQLASALDHYV